VEGSLRELYGRAMELEYDFFAEHWTSGDGEGEGGGAWRGIDPGVWGGLGRVGVFVCLCLSWGRGAVYTSSSCMLPIRVYVSAWGADVCAFKKKHTTMSCHTNVLA
jgi:hypothetical protein